MEINKPLLVVRSSKEDGSNVTRPDRWLHFLRHFAQEFTVIALGPPHENRDHNSCNARHRPLGEELCKVL